MDDDRTHIDNVLDRVHGHAGPRADIYVPMVKGMDVVIERTPMEQAMYPLEVGKGVKRH